MKKTLQKYFSHSAFTMLEFVFIVVLIGILAAVIIPNTKTNPTREAAIQVLAHIKYTQHLAMIDDKYGVNNITNWHEGRWQLLFGTSEYTDNLVAYSIFSDKPNYSGNPDLVEMAVNPMNPMQFLTGGFSGVIRTSDQRAMKEMNIGQKYGITSVTQSNCGALRIAFDYLGRPIKGNIKDDTTAYISSGNNSSLLHTPCDITLHGSDENITIRILPETGYTKIIN